MLVNCEPLSECACLNLKSFLNNSCFLCEFSRKGLQKRDFSQREDSTETQLFWCVDGTEEQTPCDASSYRASRIRTNVWTLLSKLLTNDLQRELLAEWLQHMFSKKKKKEKDSGTSICSWTNNEKRKRKKLSNKYETANYSLSSVCNKQFLW